MRSTVFAIMVSVVIAGSGSKAGAFDLTGTWQGTQTCKFISDGNKYIEPFNPDVLQITQSGAQVSIHWPAENFRYTGVVFAVAGDPTRGQVSFRLCGMRDDPTTVGEMVRARVVLKPAPQADEFHALSIFADGSQLDTCYWEYQRISTVDPRVSTCQEAALLPLGP